MKIKQTIKTFEDCTQRLTIEVNGEEEMNLVDGEPEDNNLGRNFADCFGILDLVKKAHAAGAASEPLEFEEVKTQESDDEEEDEE